MSQKPSNRSAADIASMRAAWRSPPPGRLIGKGHPAGDFLEAYDWVLEDEQLGALSIRAHLPPHVRNPRGQLFGGFTPTYVDLIALLTVRAGTDRSNAGWLATASMNVEYLAPIVGPELRIRSRVTHSRKRAHLVETRFFDLDPNDEPTGDNENDAIAAPCLCVLAITRMLEVRVEGVLGDG